MFPVLRDEYWGSLCLILTMGGGRHDGVENEYTGLIMYMV